MILSITPIQMEIARRWTWRLARHGAEVRFWVCFVGWVWIKYRYPCGAYGRIIIRPCGHVSRERLAR